MHIYPVEVVRSNGFTRATKTPEGKIEVVSFVNVDTAQSLRARDISAGKPPLDIVANPGEVVPVSRGLAYRLDGHSCVVKLFLRNWREVSAFLQEIDPQGTAEGSTQG